MTGQGTRTVLQSSIRTALYAIDNRLRGAQEHRVGPTVNIRHLEISVHE